MSNLTPQKIVDKNGKETTVHKNLDKDSASVNVRAAGVAAAAPAPAAVQAVEPPEPYEFVSETDELFKQDFFDVRDMAGKFETYAGELGDYIMNAREADPSIEYDDEVKFDEDSTYASEELVKELRESIGFLDELGQGTPTIPDDITPDNLRDTANEVAEVWENIQNNHGVTVVEASYRAEYAEDSARDWGALPDDMPDWLKNNIDWEAAADDMFDGSTNFDHNGTTYYLT
jgi:hypothetical protein